MGELGGGKQINNLYCQNKSNWRGDRWCGEGIEEHAQSLESLLVRSGIQGKSECVEKNGFLITVAKCLTEMTFNAKHLLLLFQQVQCVVTWLHELEQNDMCREVVKLSTSRKTGSREKELARNKTPLRPCLQ